MKNFDEAMATAAAAPAFSNGSQGEEWMENWCNRCVNDRGTRDGTAPEGCPLMLVAMVGDATPAEWLRQESGPDRFYCTEFRDERGGSGGDCREPGPQPEPEIDGQVDMFEVFADQVVAEVAATDRTAVSA